MATFVLVPGYWLGGWAWRAVADDLRAAGHAVYAATLTGLGERAHLAGPHVNLDTHIDDLVNLIEYEDLHDVVLVAHSGGNMSVTGAADRIPERIARLVYVDTAPLPDGVAQIEFYPPEQRAAYERQVEATGEGWRWPMPSWEDLGQGGALAGLSDADRALMRERATDEPFNAARQPGQLHNPQRRAIPSTAIWCTFSTEQVRAMIASGGPLFSELAGPQWQFVDFPTGHWPMFSRPHDLAALLGNIAGGK